MFDRLRQWIRKRRPPLATDIAAPQEVAFPAAPPPPTQIYQAEDVFRPVGVPTVTLIDRSVTKEYREIEFYLRQQGGIVSVWGHSKSGKTVLCLEILKQHNPIFLNGKHMDTEFDFWSALLSKLESPEDQSIALIRQGVVSTPEPKTAPNWSKDRSSPTPDIDFSRLRHKVTEQWIRSKRPALIDDFHSITYVVRQYILKGTKPAIDQGCTFIVISIPEETERILENFSKGGEELGRHTSVHAPEWHPDDIAQIAYKGFDALQIEVDKATIDFLTSHAHQNPLLMQSYCGRLCRFELNIDRTQQPRKSVVIDPTILPRVVSSVAAQYNPNFASYIDKGTTKARWEMRSGKSANINLLLLLAISEAPLYNPITVAGIRSNIQTLLPEDVPSPNARTIAEALERMTKRMIERHKENPPLIFDDRYADNNNKRVHIAHPFFKVFLEWYLSPMYDVMTSDEG